MSVSRKRNVIECPCDHGPHEWSFTVDGYGDEPDTCVRLCQGCYDKLKGEVLQNVINEALKYAMPHRLVIPPRGR